MKHLLRHLLRFGKGAWVASLVAGGVGVLWLLVRAPLALPLIYTAWVAALLYLIGWFLEENEQ